MSFDLEQIFTDSEGRYLLPKEVAQINDYMNQLPLRIDAMNAIQAKEDIILREVIEVIWKKFPDFQSKHMLAKDKCTRDVGYVLRYCCTSMVKDDERFLKEKILYWMRTIIHAFEFGEVIAMTYSQLLLSVQRHIQADHFALIEPFLKCTHDVLTCKDLQAEV